MRKSRTINRLLAMLLTLILCMGELSSTGLKVFAADEEEVSASENDAVRDNSISDNDTGEDTVSEDTLSGNSITDSDEEDAGEVIAADDIADTSVEEEETEGTQAEDYEEDPAFTEDAVTEEDIIIEDEELLQGDFEKNAENTMFGNVGMADPRVPSSINDEWQGSYVYYGKYKKYGDDDKTYYPVKYRVLDKSTSGEYSKTNTMLLDCDVILDFSTMNDDEYGHPWNSIDEPKVKKWLNDVFLPDSFSYLERSKIWQSTKKKKSPEDGNGEWCEYPESDYLTGEKVFILAAMELARESYGYALKTKSVSKSNQKYGMARWLRHCIGYYDNSRYIPDIPVIDGDGNIYLRQANNPKLKGGISPAFNVLAEDILFSSAVKGTRGQLGTEYKLTLRTPTGYMNVQLPASKKATVTGSKVSVPYAITGTNAVDASAVTVMILEGEYQWGYMNNTPIRYYGKLEGSGDFMTNGVGTFTLPSGFDVNKWGSSYHVYLIPEDINGEHETDYAGEPYEITKDMVIIDKEVTLTFDLQGHYQGRGYGEQKIVKGEKAIKPADPVADGYIFKGWYTSPTDHSSSKEYDFSQAVDSDITLYAYWVKEWTVGFYTNDRTTTPLLTQKVENGECATEPAEVPQRSGYNFVMWTADGTFAYRFDTPVTADLKLTAKWVEVVNYKVSFNMNGIDGTAPEDQYIETSGLVTKPADPVSDEGWEFLGWYTSAACTEEFDFDNKRIYNNTIIYAKWSDKLKIWVNGVQIGKTNLETTEYKYNTGSHQLDLKDITFNKTDRDDHNTIMWGDYVAYVYSDGIDLTVAGKGVTSASAKSNENIAGIYAKNADLTVDADLDLKGTGAGIYAKNVTIQPGSEINITSDLSVARATSGRRTFTKQPYGIFAESFAKIDGGNVNIKMTGTEAIGIDVFCGDVEIDDGSVKVEVDGTKSSRAITSMQGNIKNSLYVLEPAGGRLDEYERFFTDAYGDEAYTLELVEENSLKYTVSFDLNGKGGTAPQTQIVMKGHKAEAPAAPETEGYDFGGWYLSSDCKDDERFSFSTPVTDNITLYAKWTIKEYSVIFDLNGKGDETIYAVQIVQHGNKAVRPGTDPEVEGWLFKGWYAETECVNEYSFDTAVTESIVIYAKWEQKPDIKYYTVSFDTKGLGGTVETQTIAENGKVSKPADPHEEGWIFIGWYTDEVYTAEYDFDTPVTADIVLYAKWSKIVVPGPDPTHSPLDPVPEIKADTTQLWLVKGQKFTLDSSWSLDDSDKDKLKAYKKLFSISKTGKVNAKKPGDVVIVKKDAEGHIIQSINVNITKPELPGKKLKLEAGVTGKDEGSAKLKNADNIDVYYYSTAPDVALVFPDGSVKAVAKGSAKIIAYANGTAYTTTVSVKEPSAVKERTLHLSVKGYKSVKLTGVRKTVWDYAEGSTEEEKAVVDIKNAKVTGLKAGTVTLVAKDEMTSYKMTVKVDDPSITPVHEEDKYDLKSTGKNKYALTIAAGQKLALSFTDIDQPVIFKSSKPETAFIDENGNIEARSIGKGKFTAKVNGKTITISVKVK